MPSENQRANRLPFKVCLIPKEFYQIKSYFSTYIYNFLKLNQFWVTPFITHTHEKIIFQYVLECVKYTLSHIQHTKAKDTHQNGECPLNPLFMRFLDYLKYLLRRPSKALPWRARLETMPEKRLKSRLCYSIFKNPTFIPL